MDFIYRRFGNTWGRIIYYNDIILPHYIYSYTKYLQKNKKTIKMLMGKIFDK